MHDKKHVSATEQHRSVNTARPQGVTQITVTLQTNMHSQERDKRQVQTVKQIANSLVSAEQKQTVYIQSMVPIIRIIHRKNKRLKSEFSDGMATMTPTVINSDMRKRNSFSDLMSKDDNTESEGMPKNIEIERSRWGRKPKFKRQTASDANSHTNGNHQSVNTHFNYFTCHIRSLILIQGVHSTFKHTWPLALAYSFDSQTHSTQLYKPSCGLNLHSPSIRPTQTVNTKPYQIQVA